MCRAGLPNSLVQLSLTLCLTNFSPHDLCEYENKDYDEESVPQKMPTPLCPLLSQNVIGHLRACLTYYMVDPIRIYFSPYVQGALTKLAKEQVSHKNEDLPQDVLETNTETVETSGGSGPSTGNHLSLSKPLDELETLSVPLSAVMPMYKLDKLRKLAYYFGRKSCPITQPLFWREV